MIQIEAFKEDVWQAVWSHAKQIFVPVLILASLLGIISLAVFGFGFTSLLGEEFMQIVKENQAQDMEGFMKLQEQLQTFMASIPKTKLLGWLAFMYGISLVVGSGITHLQLLISKNNLIGEQGNWGTILKGLFTRKSLDILILIVMIALIFFGVSTVFSAIGRGSVGMAFVGLLVSMLVLIRIMGSLPASVHGEMGITESLAFSWKNITWKRSMIVVLVCIMAVIVIGLLSLLAYAIFGFMGTLGSYMFMAFQFLLFGYMSSLFIAMMSASFFRYADVEVIIDDEDFQNIEEIQE